MIILESNYKSAFWKVASSGVLLRWGFVPMVAHTSSSVIRLMQVPDKKALVSAIILRASGWTYNLVLIPSSSTGAVSEVVTDDVKVYGANGCINVDLQKDMQVTVYSVDGRIISSQMLSSGRHTVEVPKGIYIVNRTKVAVF